MLCPTPSGLYFLNGSSAKQRATFSAKEYCEHARNMLTEYTDARRKIEDKLEHLEGQRAELATQLANVKALPVLAKDRAHIAEAEEQLRRLREVRETKKYRDEIAPIKEAELKRLELLLVMEAKYVLKQAESVKANKKRLEDSLAALETARDFARGFRVIGCGATNMIIHMLLKTLIFCQWTPSGICSWRVSKKVFLTRLMLSVVSSRRIQSL